ERMLLPEETATRSTAIRIIGKKSRAFANYVAHAGTAGINLHSTEPPAYGNHLYRKRYEESHGITGGQMYLVRGSADAWVVGNVIDGAFHTPRFTATTCQQIATGLITGIEGYGFGHNLFNNEIERHTGSAMQFAGSNPTGQITISSANPLDPTD